MPSTSSNYYETSSARNDTRRGVISRRVTTTANSFESYSDLPAEVDSQFSPPPPAPVFDPEPASIDFDNNEVEEAEDEIEEAEDEAEASEEHGLAEQVVNASLQAVSEWGREVDQLRRYYEINAQRVNERELGWIGSTNTDLDGTTFMHPLMRGYLSRVLGARPRLGNSVRIYLNREGHLRLSVYDGHTGRRAILHGLELRWPLTIENIPHIQLLPDPVTRWGRRSREICITSRIMDAYLSFRENAREPFFPSVQGTALYNHIYETFVRRYQSWEVSNPAFEMPSFLTPLSFCRGKIGRAHI